MHLSFPARSAFLSSFVVHCLFLLLPVEFLLFLSVDCPQARLAYPSNSARQKPGLPTTAAIAPILRVALYFLDPSFLLRRKSLTRALATVVSARLELFTTVKLMSLFSLLHRICTSSVTPL